MDSLGKQDDSCSPVTTDQNGLESSCLTDLADEPTVGSWSVISCFHLGTPGHPTRIQEVEGLVNAKLPGPP